MPSLLDIFLVLIGFLPQVFILYFFLSLTEKSGLLNKIANVLHLPVRTLLPVCLGFGCTTLAVCSASDEKNKDRLAYFLSFIPCSAQIPLIMLLIGTVLHLPTISIILVYILSISLGILVLWIINICRQTCEQCNVVSQDTLTDITSISRAAGATTAGGRIKFPNIWLVLKDSILKTLVFMKKISIAFIISAFVIVILARFSFRFEFVTNPEQSILFSVCSVLSPVFNPIGLGNPAIICALLFGIIAKESAVSVLLLFPGVLHALPFGAGLSLLVFYLLYPKCVSCQMAMSSHCNRGIAGRVLLINLLLAYALAFVVYNLCG